MAAPDDPAEVAWRERAQRHRDWWGMSTSERQNVLRYEAGYDDGYEDGYSKGHRDALDKLLRSLDDDGLVELDEVIVNNARRRAS